MARKSLQTNKEKKDNRVKCIYCNKLIHIDNWAGVNKKGLFCNNTLCLLELVKEEEGRKNVK